MKWKKRRYSSHLLPKKTSHRTRNRDLSKPLFIRKVESEKDNTSMLTSLGPACFFLFAGRKVIVANSKIWFAREAALATAFARINVRTHHLLTELCPRRFWCLYKYHRLAVFGLTFFLYRSKLLHDRFQGDSPESKKGPLKDSSKFVGVSSYWRWF